MPGQSTRKKWTFMVYMAGDNDLDPNGVQDLKEMNRVGSSPAVNIVAQFDRSRAHAAKRYFLRKGSSARSDVVADVGRANTGDPKSLIQFVKWATAEYPAERYILVLWNHGQGWDDTDLWADERRRRFRRLGSRPIRHALFHTPARRLLRSASRSPTTRAILIDENAKDFLDNLEMKAVLRATTSMLGRKLDVLGLDACLMSMAEVGYQCRQGARYTVGSTETEPLEGWPYDTVLRALTRDPDMTPRDLSGLIVRKYMDSYRGDQVTQSACDLSQSVGLATTVRGLAQALLAGLGNAGLRQRIAAARDRVQFYDDDVKDNIDLADFCGLLKKSGVGPRVAGRCQEVIRAIKDKYVVAVGAKGADLRNSHGVAIYFPRVNVSPLYPGLDFSRRTGWHRFLKAYLRAARRR